ncbi:2OG-Fe(II) oxygenase [Actinomycetes bacterium KLBMP 9797]
MSPQRGDPAPLFVAPAPDGTPFRLDSVAGRYVVLSFLGSAAGPSGGLFEAVARTDPTPFDDRRATFVGVGTGPPAAALRAVPAGMRYARDPSGAIARAYGHPATYVLSPNLRVLGRHPATDLTPQSVVDLVTGLPALDAAGLDAPVLIVPDVVEPALCDELIRHHARTGGQPSGLMRATPDGRVALVDDPTFKRRRDVVIADDVLRQELRERIVRRLVPEIRKAFQFDATRIERYLVARYDADERGFFRAHRDNTTPATAHRRFAVSINLNTGEYEGGQLRFPEFSTRRYDVPAGGALVFSCSLQHEVTPVTQGRRYCCLPFLYDEAAAALRTP